MIGDAAKGSLIVGIALGRDDRQTREAALNAVAAAVQKSPVPFGVDSVFLNDTTDPLAAWLQENMDPFYTPPAPQP
ncbi:MAG: enhanced serine sensitivity protein SseB C-terminal domain-containing protein [Actinomadura sp.]